MINEEFKKKVKDFFSMLWGLCLLVLISGVTFVCGYLLGLNKVAVPYLSNFIKIPEDKPASVSTVTSTPAASTGKSYLSAGNTLTDAQLDGKYKRYRFSPYNESRFNFTAVLPVDWKSSPPELTLDTGTLMENLEKHKDQQIPLAELDAPGDMAAVIQTWALNVPSHVDLDKFYKKVSAALDGTIVEELPESGGRKHVIIKYKTEDGKAMLAHSVAVRAGDYVLYMNCCGKEDEFSGLSDMFNMIALSFTPEQANNLAVFDSKVSESSGQGAVVK